MAKKRENVETLDRVPLNRLHLDSGNPRHDLIEDEGEIIEQLFRAEGVLAMAKHIAEMGLNPLERVGVIEMQGNPGHYVVAEGNRRTCALKVLRDPKKAPTVALRKSFEKMSASAELPTTLPVVVFPSREVARPWLSLRHLGAQGGAGMKPWTTPQKARFAGGTSPDELALAVLDRAQQARWIDAETRRSIGLTTLTRYLGNPVVRIALGIGSRGRLVFTHEPEEVDRALKHFVLDAIPREGKATPVHSRSNRAQREEYGRSLHTSGIAPRTALPKPTPAPPPIASSLAKRRRDARSPDDRPHIVPSEFAVKSQDKNLLRLVKELRNLRPDDGFEFSTNYALRAVIERVLVLYAKKVKKHSSGMKDTQLITACANALEADGVPDRDTKIMRMAVSNLHLAYSLDTLGAAVHGAHHPTRKGMISVWDNWEPALKLMLERL